MQRVSTILLLVVFSLSLIAPALIANSASNVPACCRKDGQHHCSMLNMGEQQGRPSGPEFKSLGSKCPFFLQGGAAPASGKLGTMSPSGVFFAAIVSHPTAHAQTQAQYRVSFSRAWQERGPPALLS
jgi:hypothetical protein